MLKMIRRLFSADPIDVFVRERVAASGGSTVTLNDLYVAYRRWSEAKRWEPETMPEFSRAMHLQGIRKEKIGGRVRYFDIALRP